MLENKPYFTVSPSSLVYETAVLLQKLTEMGEFLDVINKANSGQSCVSDLINRWAARAPGSYNLTTTWDDIITYR